MFVRKGEVLGSVLHSAVPGAAPAEAKAEEPETKPEPKTEQPEPLEAPKPYDTKAEWVDYVVAKTKDSASPVSEEDAKALTKDELVDKYGG